MRVSRLIPSLMAVSALAACATHTPAPDPSAAMAAAQGEPIATAGLDWFMNRDGREVSLAYGVANSDEVKLHLLCQAGSGALEITRPISASSSPAAILSSMFFRLRPVPEISTATRIRRPALVERGDILGADRAAVAGVGEQHFPSDTHR